MRIANILAISGFTLAAVCGSALAQTAPAPGVESTVVTVTRITCIRQDSPTGSHMAGKKVCHTDAEWKQLRANAQLDMANLQDRTNNSYQGAALAGGQ